MGKNKNELDTLLFALGTAFKNNGGAFEGDVEDAVRIYNAIIMLDDSLHNKNALGRSRQTEQHFLEIINDRQANTIRGFSKEDMRSIYQSVQQCAVSEVMGQRKSGQNTDKQQIAQSYSKYGAPKGKYSTVEIEIEEQAGGAVSKHSDADEAPSNGACCVIL